MHVCCGDTDRQREAVLIHGKMNFDALDLFAAIEAAPEAGRRRMTDRLSMMTTLGTGLSPQACRHAGSSG